MLVAGCDGEAPTEASEETLRELAATRPVRRRPRGAELGLGTMAHQLADTQPQRSARIVRDVAAKLAQATRRDAPALLFVLGNAGASENAELVARHLSDAAPEVRAAAVGSAALAERARSGAPLVHALAGDADNAVRIEAPPPQLPRHDAASFAPRRARSSRTRRQVSPAHEPWMHRCLPGQRPFTREAVALRIRPAQRPAQDATRGLLW